MDTETLRKILGDVNLPSWINFPGEQTPSFSSSHPPRKAALQLHLAVLPEVKKADAIFRAA